MKPFIIFGIGDFASIVYDLITRYIQREVAFFCIDDTESQVPDHYLDTKVIFTSELIHKCPPQEYTLAIGFIGKKMFQFRENKFREMTQLGYSFENIACDSLEHLSVLGMGNIIMPNTFLGLHTTLGDGNILWPGVVFPHDNQIGCFNNFGPTSSLSGYSQVGSHCFIGNNSTIKNHVKISDYTLVGAGAYVTHDTQPEQVIVPVHSQILTEKNCWDFY